MIFMTYYIDLLLFFLLFQTPTILFSSYFDPRDNSYDL